MEYQYPPEFGYQRELTFGEAINLGFQNYCCFTGRASRSEFWWWFLFTFIVSTVAGWISYFVGDWFSGLVCLALFLPGLGLACRRLHDIGKAAGWIFLSLIPLVGGIILLIWYCKPSEPFANRFGPVPHMTA